MFSESLAKAVGDPTKKSHFFKNVLAYSFVILGCDTSNIKSGLNFSKSGIFFKILFFGISEPIALIFLFQMNSNS